MPVVDRRSSADHARSRTAGGSREAQVLSSERPWGDARLAFEELHKVRGLLTRLG